MKRFFCVFTLTLLTFFSTQVWSEKFTPASSVEELETRLLDILTINNTPGLIGAIVFEDTVFEDTVIWQGALGTANRSTGQPVTRDTLFRLGSISKSFVSLSILKLIERGELSLDLGISQEVPEAGISNAWSQDNPVKLFHLLEHTAGFDDIHVRDYVFSDPGVTLLDGIQFNIGSRDVRWPPGTRMSYSNIGPPIAALVLEKVTGQRFEDFVDIEIFDVLGMQTATFFYDSAVAASYKGDGETEEPYVHISVRPSGALNATSADMIQFLRMFIGRGELDGQILINPESLSRMETPTSTLAAKHGLKSGYGLGNYTTLKNGFVFHGHSGGIDGFISKYAYLPDHNLGYFFSINAGNGKSFRSIDNELAAFVTRDLEPAPPVTTMQLSPAELDAFSGYYEPDSPRQEIARGIATLSGVITVKAEDGKLIIGPPFGEKKEWRPVNEQSFLKEGDALPSLIFVESSANEQLLQGAGGNHRKISTFYAYSRWVLASYTILLMVSALLFAPIWIMRKFLGKLGNVKNIKIRILPLIATLSFITSILLFVTGQENLENLANLTFWSLGSWLTSILFAVLSLVSFIYVGSNYRHRENAGPFVWAHSMMVSIALVLLTGYWGYYGLIGLRTWAS